MALYSERAEAVAPGFALNAETAPVVAAVCRRLEGHPLAIELAAARTRLLPPAVQLERLEHGFELLAGGTRDAPERHRTLRATLEWSHSLLEPGEQRLYEQLGAFVGGWTLDAAEAVCAGGADVLDGLASLREQSIVGATGTEPRFSMLEPLRRFALEKLDARPEAADVRHRHARHFAALAERLEPNLALGGPGGEFELLEREHGNCRAALRSSLEAGDAETALRLAAALGRFWFVRGYASEGRQWLHDALSLDPDGEPALRAKALLREGVLALRQGDEDAAGGLLEHSLDLLRKVGDDDGVALALNLLGHWQTRRGELMAAHEAFREAAAAYERIGDERGVALMRMNLGGSHLTLGEYDSAAELSAEAIELARAVGDRVNVSVALVNLACARLELGRVEEAGPALREAIELAHSLQFKEQIVYGLEALAAFALARGEPAQSARVLGAAESLRSSIGILLDRFELTVHERTAEGSRRALGDQAFAAAWAEGSRLEPDEAVEYGLAVLAFAAAPVSARS